MWIEFQGLDSLFFRDAKPFGKGSEFKASSVFPPLPSVLRGALRTSYFAENMHEFKHAGEPGKDITEGICVHSIFLKTSSDVLLPLPLNFCVSDNEDVKLAYAMKPALNPTISSHPLSHILKSEQPNTEVAPIDALIPLQEFSAYLSGQSRPYSYVNLSEITTRELKTGIAMDYGTGTAQEHMLYKTEFVRPSDIEGNQVSMIAKVSEIPNMPKEGSVRLGGEGKLAHFKSHDDKDFISALLPKPQQLGKFFSVTLLSPAIFKSGWLPRFLDSSFEGQIGSLKIRLIAAAVGRPVSISGFDMQRRRPKDLYYAAPSGSVYYFQTLAGNTEDAIKHFHLQGISEECKTECYGMAVLGGVNIW